MATRYIEGALTAAEFDNIVNALPTKAGTVWRTDAGVLGVKDANGVTYYLAPAGSGSALTAAQVASLVGPNVHYVEVTLTNAQMLALRATPVELVAAPGAGKRLVFLSAAINGQYTAAYTESADNMVIRHVDGSGIAVSQAVEATGFVDQTGAIHTNAAPKIDAIATGAQCVNTALVLHNTGDGEYGGGNAANLTKVSVLYRVVDALA